MSLVLKGGELCEQQNRVLGGDKAGDEVKKLRQGHSWACFCPRLQGPKERVGVLSRICGKTYVLQKLWGVLER